jgi:hypothetical protein
MLASPMNAVDQIRTAWTHGEDQPIPMRCPLLRRPLNHWAAFV